MAPQCPPASASPFRLDIDLAALLQEVKTHTTASLNWKVWKGVLTAHVQPGRAGERGRSWPWSPGGGAHKIHSL